MSASLLRDAFEHHVWANERLLEACAALTREQLEAPVEGGYGSILDTLHHTVQADSFYLTIWDANRFPMIEQDAKLSIAELRIANERHAADYRAYLDRGPDPDEDLVEREEEGVFHATLGVRLAQAIHHGTDHRSQVCTAMSNLGVEPPLISVWDYGAAAGRVRAVPDDG